MRRNWKNKILGVLTGLACYGVFAGCGFVEQGLYGLGMLSQESVWHGSFYFYRQTKND